MIELLGLDMLIMLLNSLILLFYQLYLLEDLYVELLSDAEYSKLTSVCASFA